MQRLVLFIFMSIPALTLAGGIVPVPEPSTIALFASGIAAIGLIGYLKKKNK